VFINKEWFMRSFVVLGLIMFTASVCAGEDPKRSAGQLALLGFSNSLVVVESQVVDVKAKESAAVRQNQCVKTVV
jgi:hypothetical protein